MDITTVVVGIDGSEPAQRALERAIDVISAEGALHVVTAYDAPSVAQIHETYASVPEEFLDNIDMLAEQRLSMHDAARFVERKGIDAVEHLIDDDPASAILGVAALAGAELIVVGSRGRGRMSELLRGSVATKIAHHSPIDFWVVH